MPYFKDENDGIHYLDDNADESILPAGCTEITEAEADAIRMPITVYADARIAALVADCRAHIVGGCTSDALGTPHTYPTENTAERPDQQNLNGLVTMSMVKAGNPAWTCLFWCMDSQGVWDRRAHTHAEIQQVGVDVAQHVIDAQDQITALKVQIIAIRDDGELTDEEKRAAMDLVVWPA